MMNAKAFIFSNSRILAITSFMYNLNSFFQIHNKGNNALNFLNAFLRNTKIIVKNEKNSIKILRGSYLNNCKIYIYGRNNRIIVGENCRLKDVEIHIEDDNNIVTIGERTTIAGKTHLACIEGTKIIVGEDCMFSMDITIRTGDSHSIIDEIGVRINQSQDIILGNHIWVGNKVIITKGVKLGNNCIIGTGSVVTKSFEKSNITIAGVPARIVKENVSWLRQRI